MVSYQSAQSCTLIDKNQSRRVTFKLRFPKYSIKCSERSSLDKYKAFMGVCQWILWWHHTSLSWMLDTYVLVSFYGRVYAPLLCNIQDTNIYPSCDVICIPTITRYLSTHFTNTSCDVLCLARITRFFHQSSLSFNDVIFVPTATMLITISCIHMMISLSLQLTLSELFGLYFVIFWSNSY